MTSLYRGTRQFTREQLVFVAETILIGALDRLELPHEISTERDLNREAARRAGTGKANELSPYERGGLDAAGMALAVLYAQLTDDGLGIGDALGCAGEFYVACERLVGLAWQNGGLQVFARRLELPAGETFSVEEDIYNHLWPGRYPDTRKHAEAFVANLTWSNSLSE